MATKHEPCAHSPYHGDLGVLIATVATVVGVGGGSGGGPGDSSTADATPEFCGEQPAPRGGGFFAVEASGVDCKLALQIAEEWQLSGCGDTTTCSVAAGYECETRRIASEVSEVSCREGDATVEFSWGV